MISTNGIFDSTKVGALTAGQPNAAGVFFNGTHANAANGGNPIPIYSPSLWQGGSSISHLDDNSTVTNQSIMNAAAHGLGLDTRTLGAMELGILKDIGYSQVTTTTPVPVPAAVWLMASGLLGMFGASRQRQTVQAVSV